MNLYEATMSTEGMKKLVEHIKKIRTEEKK
jgi:hypothetical protein